MPFPLPFGRLGRTHKISWHLFVHVSVTWMLGCSMLLLLLLAGMLLDFVFLGRCCGVNGPFCFSLLASTLSTYVLNEISEYEASFVYPIILHAAFIYNLSLSRLFMSFLMAYFMRKFLIKMNYIRRFFTNFSSFWIFFIKDFFWFFQHSEISPNNTKL